MLCLYIYLYIHIHEQSANACNLQATSFQGEPRTPNILKPNSKEGATANISNVHMYVYRRPGGGLLQTIQTDCAEGKLNMHPLIHFSQGLESLMPGAFQKVPGVDAPGGSCGWKSSGRSEHGVYTKTFLYRVTHLISLVLYSQVL